QQYVRVTVGLPPRAGREVLHVLVATYGPARTPARERPAHRWSCTVRSLAARRKIEHALLHHAGYLRGVSRDARHAPALPGHQFVHAFFHVPPSRYVELGPAGHALLSPQTQQWLRLDEVSDWPAARQALIIEEPHSGRDGQFALYRGLESFFADNAFLRDK